jgi:hypothetical protein
MHSIAKYFKYEEIILSDEEIMKRNLIAKSNLFDIPRYFVVREDVVCVSFLYSGNRTFTIRESTDSEALAGGFGPNEVSVSMMRVVSALVSTMEYVSAYLYAVRAWRRAVPVGKTEKFEPTSVLLIARAIAYSVFDGPELDSLKVPGLAVAGTVIETVYKDTRPFVMYKPHRTYTDLCKANGIPFIVVSEMEMGCYDHTYFNFFPVNFTFLEEDVQHLCVTHDIHTPHNGRPGGIEIGIRMCDLSVNGNKGSILDYQLTMQVDAIVKYNAIGIRSVIEERKPIALCFPGDGNGVGAGIATEMGIPFRSGDIFPRHALVHHEGIIDTIKLAPKGSLIILSRVMQFLTGWEREFLEGHDVVVIDRHHIPGWFRSTDGLVSSSVPMLVNLPPMQDRRTGVPEARLPFYLLAHNSSYTVQLDDEDLVSLCRFIKLHNWNPTLKVASSQKRIVRSYNIELTNKMSTVISNTPFADIDYYCGVMGFDRRFIDGMTRRMGVSDVLVIRDEVEKTNGHAVRYGAFTYLRFREKGIGTVTLYCPTAKGKNKKTLRINHTIEIVSGHAVIAPHDVVCGTGKMVPWDEMCDAGPGIFNIVEPGPKDGGMGGFNPYGNGQTEKDYSFDQYFELRSLVTRIGINFSVQVEKISHNSWEAHVVIHSRLFPSNVWIGRGRDRNEAHGRAIALALSAWKTCF